MVTNTKVLFGGVADPRNDFICRVLSYGIFNGSVHLLNQQRLFGNYLEDRHGHQDRGGMPTQDGEQESCILYV